MSSSKTKDGRHKFKWRTYRGHKVRIDKDLTPLLDRMWELGIGTTNCCQSRCSPSCKHKKRIITYKDGSKFHTFYRTKHCGDRAWIAFDSGRSLEKFLNVVAVYKKWKKGDPDGMYDHIQGHSAKDHPHDVWEVKPYFDNCGVLVHEERIPAVQAMGTRHKTIGVWEEDGCKKNDFRLMPQMWIPRKHFQYIIQRLDLALSKRKKKLNG